MWVALATTLMPLGSSHTNHQPKQLSAAAFACQATGDWVLLCGKAAALELSSGFVHHSACFQHTLPPKNAQHELKQPVALVA
jgi:hypothetical protein